MSDKIKDIVVTIIFLFTVISLFLINVIKEDTDISVAERRKLATMPELTTKSLFDGTYFKKFDSYVTDQFVERDAFRKIKIDIELSTKGEYNNLYLYDDYIIEEIFPLNSNSINNLTNKINYIKDTYLNNNSNIYYTIIPDKNYFVNNGNLKLDYNKLQDMMKNNLSNINYINIFDKLTLDNYYKTDTHWKEEDLFNVANTIANQMNFDITNNNNVVNTITTFKGSYAGRLSVTKDIDTIKTVSNPSTLNSSVYNYETKKYTDIYDYTKINSLDKYDIYLSGAVPIIDIINNNSSSDKELIVFRDSYGSSLIPLLIEGYKKITVIDIRYISSKILNKYIDFNDQDVLFMYSILTINNSFSIR
ncbi:MAG: DHHW family protein [Bacilli bacterium]